MQESLKWKVQTINTYLPHRYPQRSLSGEVEVKNASQRMKKTREDLLSVDEGEESVDWQ